MFRKHEDEYTPSTIVATEDPRYTYKVGDLVVHRASGRRGVVIALTEDVGGYVLAVDFDACAVAIDCEIVHASRYIV